MWFRFRPLRDSETPVRDRAVRRRLWIGLLAAVLAAEAPVKTPPIPEPGPLAQPMRLDQVGFPAHRPADSARQSRRRVELGVFPSKSRLPPFALLAAARKCAVS